MPSRLPAAGFAYIGQKTSRSRFCAYRWTQNVTEAEPCRFAEIKKATNGWSTKTRSVHKPIGQRLHEENERVLFCIGQTQMTNFARVHIGGRFRRWLGGRAFARIMGLAARQHIARVLSTMVISLRRMALD
jgi:hypothetical protein